MKTIEGEGDIGNLWKSDVPQTKRSWMLMKPRFCFDSQAHFYIFLQASPLLGLLLFQQNKFRVHKLST